MSNEQGARETIVLVDATVAHAGPGAYKGLHALVPVLVGLTVPIIVFWLFDPRALGNGRLVLHIVLLAVGIVAAAVFFMSLINPGSIVQASFDPARRTVDLVRSGAFANNILTLPFSRIVSARMETIYDDDGYQQRVPLLVLGNRETYPLPSGTTDADIANIRALLGIR